MGEVGVVSNIVVVACPELVEGVVITGVAVAIIGGIIVGVVLAICLCTPGAVSKPGGTIPDRPAPCSIKPRTTPCPA